jgi:ABC-type nitrate/sulfonate/bicarbonate transport system substrate-binding protein
LTHSFIADQPPLIENVIKALLESLAYMMAPKNQNAVAVPLPERFQTYIKSS